MRKLLEVLKDILFEFRLYLIDTLILLLVIIFICMFSFFNNFKESESSEFKSTGGIKLPDGWWHHNKRNGLLSDDVVHMAEYDNGKIIVSCSAGLCAWNGDLWRHFDSFNKKLFYKRAEYLLADDVNGFWITFDQKGDSLVTKFGLWHFNGEKFEKIRKIACEALAIAPGPRVWTVEKYKNELYCDGIENRVIKFKELGLNSFGYELLTDKTGRLWFFGDEGFGWINGNSHHVFKNNCAEMKMYPGKYLNSDKVFATNGIGFFCVWIDSRAAFTWSEKGFWCQYDSLWEALIANVSHLKTSGSNTSLWSVAGDAVICRNKVLIDGQWHQIPALHKAGPLDITSVCVLGNGEIWFSTYGSGIFVCSSIDCLLNEVAWCKNI